MNVAFYEEAIAKLCVRIVGITVFENLNK